MQQQLALLERIANNPNTNMMERIQAALRYDELQLQMRQQEVRSEGGFIEALKSMFGFEDDQAGVVSEEENGMVQSYKVSEREQAKEPVVVTEQEDDEIAQERNSEGTLRKRLVKLIEEPKFN